jgi:heptosyltransferase-1
MRLVLTRLSALGDIVHTWPLAVALKAADPGFHLTWVVERAFAPLVEGHPAVDAVVTVTTKAWRRRPLALATRYEIGVLRSRLRELEPDACLDPQGTLKSSLVCRLSAAPRRIGLARPWRREILAGHAYTETMAGASGRAHVTATNLEFVRIAGGAPVSPAPAPDGRWLLGDRADPPSPGVVLLPGAGRPEKVLAVATLADVAQRLAADGLGVTVAWGPGEEPRAADIVRRSKGTAELAPPTSIVELATLMAAAVGVVGGDTGPVHLAASLGVPTLGVFLTTDPDRNGPRGPRVDVVSNVTVRHRGPTGSSGARPGPAPTAEAIHAAVRNLLRSNGGRPDGRCYNRA